MRKLFIAIALIIGLNSFAQEKVKTESEKSEFKCDLIKFDTEQKAFELTGNVSFKTEIIELKNVDKIVFNKLTNEIVVSGLKDFTIDGAIQIYEKANKKILKYKIGERIAFVE